MLDFASSENPKPWSNLGLVAHVLWRFKIQFSCMAELRDWIYVGDGGSLYRWRRKCVRVLLPTPLNRLFRLFSAARPPGFRVRLRKPTLEFEVRLQNVCEIWGFLAKNVDFFIENFLLARSARSKTLKDLIFSWSEKTIPTKFRYSCVFTR